MKEFNGKVIGQRSLYSSANYKIFACVVTSGMETLEDEKNWYITIAGDIPELQTGVEYNLKAIPKTTKYGLTYNVKHISVDMKGEGRNIFYKAFLESITEYAYEILQVYPNFVDMIMKGEDDKIDLSKIKGVKETRFNGIKKKILENVAVMDVLEEYAEYELTFAMATRILIACNGSIDLVREKMENNPYKMLTGISGVGFKRADQLIMKIRPELRDSPYRLYSCASYLLEENENNGSTWMYFKDLYKQMGEMIPEAMKNIVKVIENTEDFYFDKEENRISNASVRFKEEYIANKIKEILNNEELKQSWYEILANKEPEYEKFRNLDGQFDLSDEQMKTLPMMFHNNCAVLTGSAGMGKSSGAKGLLNMLDWIGLSYRLTAPTGAASEVLSKYTKRKASTIHRAIYRSMEDEGGHLIDDSLLVIDEASMINTDLMFMTLREISPHTKVLFICDPEQIPAIGAGKVIHDFIECGVIPVNKLTKVYRFDEGGLDQVTTKVRLGQKYLPKEIDGKSLTFGEKSDYSFILSPKSEMMKDLLQVYFGFIKAGYDVSDIGIMSSMNVKELGTIDINTTIQEIISKGKPFIKYGNTEYRLGDKVVQIKNNYSAISAIDNNYAVEIFNGNQGKIIEIDQMEKTLVVDFGSGKKVLYFMDTLSELSLAYATSVHKFQGSGCKIALVVTPSSHTFMLNKNLLYTALTRSTIRTIHFCDKIETINTALRKSENFTRNTFLKELLQSA